MFWQIYGLLFNVDTSDEDHSIEKQKECLSEALQMLF